MPPNPLSVQPGLPVRSPNQTPPGSPSLAQLRGCRLFSDVDGTLTDASGHVPWPLQLPLRRLAQEGRLAFLTGRPPRGLSLLFNILGRRVPFVALNGAFISPRGGSAGRVIGRLPPGFPQQSLAPFWNHPLLWIHLYALGNWYTNRGGELLDREVRLQGFSPILTAQPLHFREPLLKCSVHCLDWDGAQDFIKAMAACAELTLTWSPPAILELSPRGVDKGKGLRELLGLRPDLGPLCRVLLLGDGDNDIPAFRAAPLCCAMPCSSAGLLRTARLLLSEPHIPELAKLLTSL